jgi:hypothetical protein
MAALSLACLQVQHFSNLWPSSTSSCYLVDWWRCSTIIRCSARPWVHGDASQEVECLTILSTLAISSRGCWIIISTYEIPFPLWVSLLWVVLDKAIDRGKWLVQELMRFDSLNTESCDSVEYDLWSLALRVKFVHTDKWLLSTFYVSQLSFKLFP